MCDCSNKTNDKKNCNCGSKHSGDNHVGGAIYGLGLIGAMVYFLPAATNFQTGLLGFLKALVWPAMLVHAALKSLGV